MTARSVEEQGSSFLFDIPLEVDADERQSPALAGPGKVVGVEPGQPVHRVLVVDDEPTNRQLLLSLLDLLNGRGDWEPIIETREAANGQEAIDLWESWQPHLILMDMRMPVLGGEAATREIKARVRTRPDAVSSVVVAVSASAFEEDRAAFLACGCDDFVGKPLREEQLTDLLARHLGTRFVFSPPPRGSQSTALNMEDLAQRLRSCPGAWIADLRYAVEVGDFARVAELIQVIRPQDSEVAARLEEWAHNYDQGTLLHLIRLVEVAA